jgi:5-methylcytosine-specific restriction endonuclease McrA
MNGVNKVCKQCIRACKQYAQVELIACPKFFSIRRAQSGETVPTFRRAKIAQPPKQRKIKAKRPNGHGKQDFDYSASPTPRGSCPICKSQKATSKHHILPRALGGTDDKKNIVWLCPDCHNIVEEHTSEDSLYCPKMVKHIRVAHLGVQ